MEVWSAARKREKLESRKTVVRRHVFHDCKLKRLLALANQIYNYSSLKQQRHTSSKLNVEVDRPSKPCQPRTVVMRCRKQYV